MVLNNNWEYMTYFNYTFIFTWRSGRREEVPLKDVSKHVADNEELKKIIQDYITSPGFTFHNDL